MQEHVREIRKKVQERTIGYVAAAFGVVAGFAWNDAVKAFIEFVFPLPQNTLVAKFIYAFVLTLVLVFVALYLTRLLKKFDGISTATGEEETKL